MSYGGEEIIEIKRPLEIPNSQLILIGIPSKGRMATETLEFLTKCGFKIMRNRQQYIGWLAGFPEIQIVFQRQEDIIHGVMKGSLAYGIVGLDLLNEITKKDPDKTVIIHDDLGFGKCTLEVLIPEEWTDNSMRDLNKNKKVLRVASKFPFLTRKFFSHYNLNFELVEAAGTLEVAPALGYSDIIVDLVSTGQTLKDNRLKRLQDGCILQSQACFIANRKSLKENKMVLNFAQTFLEACNITIPSDMQGESLIPLLKAEKDKWKRDAVYYHYYEYPAEHMVMRHYGIVSKEYKLIHFYYDVDEWELYDRKKDPQEMKSVYSDPAYAEVVRDYKIKLAEFISTDSTKSSAS